MKLTCNIIFVSVLFSLTRLKLIFSLLERFNRIFVKYFKTTSLLTKRQQRMRPKNAWSLEIPILFCFHSLYQFFYINDLHISPFLQTILPRAFIFGVKFYKLLSRELMPLLFHFQFKTYFKYKFKITFLNLNLLLFKVNPAIDPCNNRYIKGSTYPYQF